MKGFLEDVNGNKSSIRLAGFMYLGISLLVSVLGLIFEYPNLGAVIWPFVFASGACFGVSVMEKKM